MLVQEGLPGRPELGWESDYLYLVLQVPRTFNESTVRVRVDVPLQCSHEGYDVELPMLVPDINDDGVVVARRIAAVVNLSENDYYEVLVVVLNALHLLLDVPCVELWNIVYFVPKKDVALLLCYSKCILCYMLLELPPVTIAVGVLFKEGRVWISILEWLDVMFC